MRVRVRTGERGALGVLGRVSGEVVGVVCRSASLYVDKGWNMEKMDSCSLCD